MVAFNILEDNESPPPGLTKSSGHCMFDVKMDFTRKARWVKDGHLTPYPETSSYAGVVRRKSISILLTYAEIHEVDVMAADIRNSYLQEPTSESTSLFVMQTSMSSRNLENGPWSCMLCMAVNLQAETSGCTCMHVGIFWDLPHALLNLMYGWEIPNVGMEQIIMSM